ncbi:hypothetical protein IAQ61_008226 [Plenodomus lingam]|uniref:uncharacterized protein n=1 Tax=Leptosphaeria maculans TaxID=5022 RepID=UPI0033308573|nr:hypothetical protein IAQ61_008226 [Plenodomus lingam]
MMNQPYVAITIPSPRDNRDNSSDLVWTALGNESHSNGALLSVRSVTGGRVRPQANPLNLADFVG